MRRFTPRAFIAALAMVAVVAGPANAWCPFSNLPQAPFATSYLFWIEDDFVGWNRFFGGTLSNVANDPNYYRPILEHWLDSALQQWSRVGRVPIKLGIAGWAPDGSVTADDDISLISTLGCRVANAYRGNASFFAGSADIEFRHDDPDFVPYNETLPNGEVMEYTGECNNITPLELLPQADGRLFREANALLRHELGHTLDLAHHDVLCSTIDSPNDGDPNGVPFTITGIDDNGAGGTLIIQTQQQHGFTAGSPLAVPPIPGTLASVIGANTGGRTYNGLYRVAQVLSTTSFRTAGVDLGSDNDAAGAVGTVVKSAGTLDDSFFPRGGLVGNNQGEMPAGNDIEGVQESWRDQLFSLPRRAVHLTAGYVDGATNAWVKRTTDPLPIFSVYQPRFSCTPGTTNPQCVMIRAHNESELRFNTMSMTVTTTPTYSTNPVLGTSVSSTNFATRSSPDVAVNAAGTLAVGVASRQTLTDSSIPNDWAVLPAQFLRYQDLSTGGYLSNQGDIDPATDDDITANGPRIAFVRGLTRTSCGPGLPARRHPAQAPTAVFSERVKAPTAQVDSSW